MQTSNVCSVCNESGHIPRKCPELRSDMNEGFYSGGGSNRDYGEEDQSKYISLNLSDATSHSQYSWLNRRSVISDSCSPCLRQRTFIRSCNA